MPYNQQRVNILTISWRLVAQAYAVNETDSGVISVGLKTMKTIHFDS